MCPGGYAKVTPVDASLACRDLDSSIMSGVGKRFEGAAATELVAHVWGAHACTIRRGIK